MKKVLFALSLVAIGFGSNAQNLIGGYIYKQDTTVLPKYPAYKVWLIDYNATAGTLTAVDSLTITASTTLYPRPYMFYNANATSTYMVKAAITNGPTSGSGYAPTYADSSIFWSGADGHKWTSIDSVNRMIWMKKGTVSSGPGFIGGSISAGANKSTAQGDAIPNMTVYLLDAAGTSLIQTTTTDATGAFSFSNVAVGNYRVYPEDAGSATTPVLLTVSSMSQTNFTNVDFEKSFSLKTVKPKPNGIANIGENKIFSLYPNPASDKLTVKLNTANTTAHVTIMNTEGRIVLSQEVKLANQTATINIASFAKGSYFVTVQDGSKTATQSVVLQ